MKKIKITCEGADAVPFTSIKDFQGELKEMDKVDKDRLIAEILENGFNSPIHVWKQGKTLWNLDGHQRIAVLTHLEADGYVIPDVPVDYIKAASKEKAKHILLSRVKQYGKVTQTGLHEYMQGANMDINHLQSSFGDLPGVDVDQFAKDFFQPPEQKEIKGASEVPAESYSAMTHECPKCGFKFGKGAK